MYCENCGARIDDDSKFCENCGVLVNPDAEPEEPAEPESAEPEVREVEAAPSDTKEQAVTDLDQLLNLDLEPTPKKEYGLSDHTQIFTKETFFKETPPQEPDAESKDLKEDEKISEGETEVPVADVSCEQEEGPEGPEAEKELQEEKAELPEAEAVFAGAEPVKTEPATELFAEETRQPEEEKTAEEPESQEAKEEVFIWRKDEDEEKTEEPEEEMDVRVEEPEPVSEEPSLLSQEKTGEPEISETADDGAAEEAESEKPLFCMACGRRLPKGAAFCDACGTPTGEVAPVEIHRRRPGQGMFAELAKEFFVKPAAAIEKAASEDAFLPGVVFLLIKDVILAVLAAVFMGKMSATLGIFGTWLIQGDAFGFGAKMFLIAIVLDVLWIGLLYGAGMLFKGKGSIRELTGACGTASLLTTALLIVTIVLTAFVPVAALCSVLITLAATIAVMVKASAQAMHTDENLGLYAVPTAFACFIIIVFVALRLLA
ncbi:zinc-ribbon domain-containing protein [Anaerovorax odorimutans]|uniref:Zinc-ribbon domain-containing protein n=1 Tax=Anaerovorax odorimutans TaxID=109327 RepID=A0ABT1RNL5_9FIRM|nr:zinc-ribbon domain-containing protein [Anaerovorax odorimutans]MCQ4636765.1 zinc-ribbon domain-containing protein [Anaerovorax odorimutans]